MTHSTYAEKAIAKRDIITVIILFGKLIRYDYQARIQFKTKIAYVCIFA